jgi:hypothetical protein
MKRFQRCEYFLGAILLFAGSAMSIQGQTAGGSISGRVTDSTGAVVVGATLNLTSVERGTITTSSSNDAGIYVFPSVPVGQYRMAITREGFRQAEVKQIDVNVNDHIEQNIQLEVGSSQQTVTVESQEALVETITSTVSAVVTGAAIQDLPLNGRDTLQLALTQPGVLPTVMQNSGVGPSQGEFTVAGGRDTSVTYLLDGGVNTSVTYGVPVVNPNPDTVSEFRILVNNYGAEYGRSNGGVVSVVMKSGTNSFHGTLFDYLRNTDFNANYFFNQSTPGAYQPRPILRRNQFGGTIGGPVKKDKLFFFFGYQGQRQSSVSVGSQVGTFTPAEVSGNFSRAANGAPPSGLVSFLQAHPYFQPNPALAAQGIIDPGSFDPVAKAYISHNLIPTSPTGTLTPNGGATSNIDEYDARADYEIASADRLTVTLVASKNPQLVPFLSGVGNAPNVGGYPGTNDYKDYFGNVSYTTVFTPSIVNEFHFTAQRNNILLNFPAMQLPTPSQLGIRITPDAATGPTQIFLNASGIALGFQANGPANYVDNTYLYADTATWVRGQHTWKFGGSLGFVQNNAYFAYQTNGGFTFSGPTGIGTGLDLADFLLGLPDQYAQWPKAYSAVRSQQYGLFAQDEWKAASNLTLTLGLRYEYQTPKYDPQKRNYMIVPGKQSQLFPNAPLGMLFPGDPGTPSKGISFPDRTNFAPRVGLAWDPTGKGKLSIRTGFGIFFDTLLAQDNQQQNGTVPFFSAVGLYYSSSAVPVNGPGTIMSNPFAAAGTTNPFPSKPLTRNTDFTQFFPIGLGSVFINPHLTPPYTYQYNFTVQYQLARALALEIGYVGSSSYKLTAETDSNPFIIGTNTRILNAQPGLQHASPYTAMPLSYGNYANANYNGMVASITKRSGELRGIGQLFFTSSLTWGHNLNDADGFGRNSMYVDPYNRHQFYASADSDIRLRFVTSGGWELPFDKAWSRGPKRLTTGWTLYPIFSGQTGLPYDVNAGLAFNPSSPGPSGDGLASLLTGVFLVRPNWSGGSVQALDAHQTRTYTVNGTPLTGSFFFNPTPMYLPGCFSSSCPTPTFGTLQRNAVRGPGYWNMDLALGKEVQLFERAKLLFRAEFFNIFNHTEWQLPVTSTPITSPLFGQITSTYAPRIGQLALKVVF